MKRPRVALALTVMAGIFCLAGTAMLFVSPAFGADEAMRSAIAPGVLQWGYLAAALATGMSSLGAGYAVAAVGSAAVGALAEKPELLGRTIVLVGLAEGIAIYGLIVSILILNRLG